MESGVCIVMALVATATSLQHIPGMGNRIRHVFNWIAFLNAFALLLLVILNMERISSDVPEFILAIWEEAWRFQHPGQLSFTLFWLLNIPWPIVQYIVWNEWYFVPWNFDPDEYDRDYE